MIELENISKVFSTSDGDVHAVKDVSLHVPKGEIHGVIGYSGAGKSTLIRCVNLLEKPTSGSAFIKGQEITALEHNELRHVRQDVGMIFQGFNLLKTANVRENIAIPLKLLGLSKKEVAERVDKYLDIVGLTDRKEAYPNQLSGGQKQRVAIARALSQEPEVLLSDEATSALDPETTESILDLLLKINEEFGITILLITHEMNVVQKICDQVHVLEDGSVVEAGPTIELFARPKHQTTKRFLNTVSQRKLSDSLISQLNLTGSVVHLTFIGDNTGDPILAKMSEQFRVTPNILTANIIQLKNGIVGNLGVHLTGEADQIKKAMAFFEAENIQIEYLEGQK